MLVVCWQSKFRLLSLHDCTQFQSSMFNAKERGLAMSLFAAAPFLGPSLVSVFLIAAHFFSELFCRVPLLVASLVNPKVRMHVFGSSI